MKMFERAPRGPCVTARAIPKYAFKKDNIFNYLQSLFRFFVGYKTEIIVKRGGIMSRVVGRYLTCQYSSYKQVYATEIKSIQLHDSIVMASP